MLIKSASNDQPLLPEEEKRVDELLSYARKYHHWGLIIASLSLLLSSLEDRSKFTLPFGDVQVPGFQTALSLYILVIISLIASWRLYFMATPWLKLDPRRPPYAWVALGTGSINRPSVILWIFLPVVISAYATSYMVERSALNFSYLAFLGLLTVVTPTTIEKYRNLIDSGDDERGGKATYSIYLLYWYRLCRSLAFIVILWYPFLVLIPNWNVHAPELAVVIGATILIFVYIIRTIAGTKRVYRWIDRKGVKKGFPETSIHYD